MSNSIMTKKGIIFRILLVIILFLVLFPLYWILNTSLKGSLENISPIPTFFPKALTFENFTSVLQGGFLGNLLNSLFVALFSTSLSLVLAFLASYSLVRYKFPYKLNVLFLIWVLIVKILPPMVLSIPLYTLFSQVGLINNLWGLVLVYQVYTLPYCIWMLFGFMKGLPVEFEQAAEIDGASPMKVLTNIVVPLSSSGIAATAIFSVIISWDEFLFALLFIRTPSLQTLPLRIVSFITEYETLWGELMAVGLLATIPILCFSRYYYKKLSAGFSMGLK